MIQNIKQCKIHSVRNPIKITRHVKEQENMTHKGEKNPLIGTDPRII